MSVVGDLELEEAKTLVELGALVARAEAVHERMASGEIELLGLFERPRPSDIVELARESRFSVPPPPVGGEGRRHEGASAARVPIDPADPRGVRAADRLEPAARGDDVFEAAERSTATAAHAPRVTIASAACRRKKLREPSRALFLPVANAALAALARGSKGYLQGLFVLTLDHRASDPKRPIATKRRVVVQLVVVDVAGILRALDPAVDVVEAAVAMVEADRREGNGEWRKLSARITPKRDGGATLHVDVL